MSKVHNRHCSVMLFFWFVLLQPLVDGGNWLFSISDACEEVCGEDEEVRHNSKV